MNNEVEIDFDIDASAVIDEEDEEKSGISVSYKRILRDFENPNYNSQAAFMF